ncbi:MAG: hypothetical protein GY870_01545 [archaeon]|nr:hypothetical protein [archaeon]
MNPIQAIKAALKIKDLWLMAGEVKEEHECEAQALQTMYQNFLDAIVGDPSFYVDEDFIMSCQDCVDTHTRLKAQPNCKSCTKIKFN